MPCRSAPLLPARHPIHLSLIAGILFYKNMAYKIPDYAAIHHLFWEKQYQAFQNMPALYH
jgi:hypothetical protein